VELARDPRPLLGDRHPLRVLPLAADEAPDGDRHRHREQGPEPLPDAFVVAEERHDREPERQHGDRDHRPQVVDLDGQRVEEQEDRDIAHDEVAVLGREQPR
jgi:hypothetical protein